MFVNKRTSYTLSSLIIIVLLINLLFSGLVFAESDLKINSVLPDKDSPQPLNTEVTWTVHAEGGEGELRYAFYFYKDGVFQFSQWYTADPTFTHASAEAGIYHVSAFVRDMATGETLRRNSAQFEFYEGEYGDPDPLQINSVEPNLASPQPVGASVIWTVDAEGGVGELRYAFYFYKDSVFQFSQWYTADPTFSHTPSEAGTYHVSAFVRDMATGETLRRNSAQFEFIIPEAVQNAVESFTLDQVEAGTPVIATTVYKDNIAEVDLSWRVDVWMESTTAIPEGSIVTISYMGAPYGDSVTLTEDITEIWLSELMNDANPAAVPHRTQLAGQNGLTIVFELDVTLPDGTEDITTTITATNVTSTDDFNNVRVELKEATANAAFIMVDFDVEVVIAMIDALPQADDLTMGDRDDVEAARAAYDALTPDQQALVTNYDELVAAENAIEHLDGLIATEANIEVATLNNGLWNSIYKDGEIYRTVKGQIVEGSLNVEIIDNIVAITAVSFFDVYNTDEEHPIGIQLELLDKPVDAKYYDFLADLHSLKSSYGTAGLVEGVVLNFIQIGESPDWNYEGPRDSATDYLVILDEYGNVLQVRPIAFIIEEIDPTYDLTMLVDPAGSGTAIDLTDDGPYVESTQVNILAVSGEKWEFISWISGAGSFDNTDDPETIFTMPAENVTVTAIFKLKEYTVTFIDWDDSVLDIQSVEHSSDAVAPANPVREGYTFIAWDTDFTNVTEDLTVKALYAVTTYTVTFVEENGLADVSIQIYSDEDRTVSVGDPLTTDTNGIATQDLPDGQYWFTASLSGYEIYPGYFLVGGSDMAVNFEMAPEAQSGPFVLKNPYAGVNWDSVNQYKANFHTHTNESDGLHDPDYVIDAYYGAGYKILALTDHDTQGPGGSWPPNIGTTWPWTNWGRDPEALGMLAVEGNEISAPHHHLSLFNDWGAASTTVENSLNEIENRGGLSILSHPGRYTSLYYEFSYQPYPAPLEDSWYVNLYQTYHHAPLVGIEVYTLGDSYPYDRELWDRLNALVMPNITIFGYSVDDMHHYSQMFRNYQFMLMENLTEAALREAMRTGAFYFCYEPGRTGNVNPPVPRINRIEVTGGGTVINITAANYNSITWRTDKGIVGSGSMIDLKTLDLDGDKFIRAELLNGSGITHTQPFVLGY